MSLKTVRPSSFFASATPLIQPEPQIQNVSLNPFDPKMESDMYKQYEMLQNAFRDNFDLYTNNTQARTKTVFDAINNKQILGTKTEGTGLFGLFGDKEVPDKPYDYNNLSDEQKNNYLNKALRTIFATDNNDYYALGSYKAIEDGLREKDEDLYRLFSSPSLRGIDEENDDGKLTHKYGNQKYFDSMLEARKQMNNLRASKGQQPLSLSGYAGIEDLRQQYSNQDLSGVIEEGQRTELEKEYDLPSGMQKLVEDDIHRNPAKYYGDPEEVYNNTLKKLEEILPYTTPYAKDIIAQTGASAMGGAAWLKGFVGKVVDIFNGQDDIVEDVFEGESVLRARTQVPELAQSLYATTQYPSGQYTIDENGNDIFVANPENIQRIKGILNNQATSLMAKIISSTEETDRLEATVKGSIGKTDEFVDIDDLMQTLGRSGDSSGILWGLRDNLNLLSKTEGIKQYGKEFIALKEIMRMWNEYDELNDIVSTKGNVISKGRGTDGIIPDALESAFGWIDRTIGKGLKRYVDRDLRNFSTLDNISKPLFTGEFSDENATLNTQTQIYDLLNQIQNNTEASPEEKEVLWRMMDQDQYSTRYGANLTAGIAGELVPMMPIMKAVKLGLNSGKTIAPILTKKAQEGNKYATNLLKVGAFTKNVAKNTFDYIGSKKIYQKSFGRMHREVYKDIERIKELHEDGKLAGINNFLSTKVFPSTRYFNPRNTLRFEGEIIDRGRSLLGAAGESYLSMATASFVLGMVSRTGLSPDELLESANDMGTFGAIAGYFGKAFQRAGKVALTQKELGKRYLASMQKTPEGYFQYLDAVSSEYYAIGNVLANIPQSAVSTIGMQEDLPEYMQSRLGQAFLIDLSAGLLLSYGDIKSFAGKNKWINAYKDNNFIMTYRETDEMQKRYRNRINIADKVYTYNDLSFSELVNAKKNGQIRSITPAELFEDLKKEANIESDGTLSSVLEKLPQHMLNESKRIKQIINDDTDYTFKSLPDILESSAKKLSKVQSILSELYPEGIKIGAANFEGALDDKIAKAVPEESQVIFNANDIELNNIDNTAATPLTVYSVLMEEVNHLIAKKVSDGAKGAYAAALVNKSTTDMIEAVRSLDMSIIDSIIEETSPSKYKNDKDLPDPDEVFKIKEYVEYALSDPIEFIAALYNTHGNGRTIRALTKYAMGTSVDVNGETLSNFGKQFKALDARLFNLADEWLIQDVNQLFEDNIATIAEEAKAEEEALREQIRQENEVDLPEVKEEELEPNIEAEQLPDDLYEGLIEENTYEADVVLPEELEPELPPKELEPNIENDPDYIDKLVMFPDDYDKVEEVEPNIPEATDVEPTLPPEDVALEPEIEDKRMESISAEDAERLFAEADSYAEYDLYNEDDLDTNPEEYAATLSSLNNYLRLRNDGTKIQGMDEAALYAIQKRLVNYNHAVRKYPKSFYRTLSLDEVISAAVIEHGSDFSTADLHKIIIRKQEDFDNGIISNITNDIINRSIAESMGEKLTYNEQEAEEQIRHEKEANEENQFDGSENDYELLGYSNKEDMLEKEFNYAYYIYKKTQKEKGASFRWYDAIKKINDEITSKLKERLEEEIGAGRVTREEAAIRISRMRSKINYTKRFNHQTLVIGEKGGPKLRKNNSRFTHSQVRIPKYTSMKLHHEQFVRHHLKEDGLLRYTDNEAFKELFNEDNINLIVEVEDKGQYLNRMKDYHKTDVNLSSKLIDQGYFLIPKDSGGLLIDIRKINTALSNKATKLKMQIKREAAEFEAPMTAAQIESRAMAIIAEDISNGIFKSIIQTDGLLLREDVRELFKTNNVKETKARLKFIIDVGNKDALQEFLRSDPKEADVNAELIQALFAEKHSTKINEDEVRFANYANTLNGLRDMYKIYNKNNNSYIDVDNDIPANYIKLSLINQLYSLSYDLTGQNYFPIRKEGKIGKSKNTIKYLNNFIDRSGSINTFLHMDDLYRQLPELKSNPQLAAEYGIEIKNRGTNANLLFLNTDLLGDMYNDSNLGTVFSDQFPDGGAIITKPKLTQLLSKMTGNLGITGGVKPKGNWFTKNGAITLKTLFQNDVYNEALSPEDQSIKDYFDNINGIAGVINSSSLKNDFQVKYNEISFISNPDLKWIVSDSGSLKYAVDEKGNILNDASEDILAERQKYREMLDKGIIPEQLKIRIPLTGRDAINITQTLHEGSTATGGSAMQVNNIASFGHNTAAMQGDPNGKLALDAISKSVTNTAIYWTKKINNLKTLNVALDYAKKARPTYSSTLNRRLDYNEFNSDKKAELANKVSGKRVVEIKNAFKDIHSYLENIPNKEREFLNISNRYEYDTFLELFDRGSKAKPEDLPQLIFEIGLSADELLYGRGQSRKGLLRQMTYKYIDKGLKSHTNGYIGTLTASLYHKTAFDNAMREKLNEYGERNQDGGIDVSPEKTKQIQTFANDLYAEHFDPNTNRLKDGSRGVIISRVDLEKLRKQSGNPHLGLGDPVIVGRTPTDNIDMTFAGVIVGVSDTPGGIHINRLTAEKVFDADYDKDGIYIRTQDKSYGDDGFMDMYEYLANTLAHTGALKSGIESYEDMMHTEKNEVNQFNKEFNLSYKPRNANPILNPESSYNAHAAQGAVIGLRTSIADLFRNKKPDKIKDGIAYYKHQYIYAKEVQTVYFRKKMNTRNVDGTYMDDDYLMTTFLTRLAVDSYNFASVEPTRAMIEYFTNERFDEFELKALTSSLRQRNKDDWYEKTKVGKGPNDRGNKKVESLNPAKVMQSWLDKSQSVVETPENELGYIEAKIKIQNGKILDNAQKINDNYFKNNDQTKGKWKQIKTEIDHMLDIIHDAVSSDLFGRPHSSKYPNAVFGRMAESTFIESVKNDLYTKKAALSLINQLYKQPYMNLSDHIVAKGGDITIEVQSGKFIKKVGDKIVDSVPLDKIIGDDLQFTKDWLRLSWFFTNKRLTPSWNEHTKEESNAKTDKEEIKDDYRVDRKSIQKFSRPVINAIKDLAYDVIKRAGWDLTHGDQLITYMLTRRLDTEYDKFGKSGQGKLAGSFLTAYKTELKDGMPDELHIDSEKVIWDLMQSGVDLKIGDRKYIDVLKENKHEFANKYITTGNDEFAASKSSLLNAVAGIIPKGARKYGVIHAVANLLSDRKFKKFRDEFKELLINEDKRLEGFTSMEMLNTTLEDGTNVLDAVSEAVNKVLDDNLEKYFGDKANTKEEQQALSDEFKQFLLPERVRNSIKARSTYGKKHAKVLENMLYSIMVEELYSYQKSGIQKWLDNKFPKLQLNKDKMPFSTINNGHIGDDLSTNKEFTTQEDVMLTVPRIIDGEVSDQNINITHGRTLRKAFGQSLPAMMLGKAYKYITRPFEEIKTKENALKYYLGTTLDNMQKDEFAASSLTNLKFMYKDQPEILHIFNNIKPIYTIGNDIKASEPAFTIEGVEGKKSREEAAKIIANAIDVRGKQQGVTETAETFGQKEVMVQNILDLMYTKAVAGGYNVQIGYMLKSFADNLKNQGMPPEIVNTINEQADRQIDLGESYQSSNLNETLSFYTTIKKDGSDRILNAIDDLNNSVLGKKNEQIKTLNIASSLEQLLKNAEVENGAKIIKDIVTEAKSMINSGVDYSEYLSASVDDIINNSTLEESVKSSILNRIENLIKAKTYRSPSEILKRMGIKGFENKTTETELAATKFIKSLITNYLNKDSSRSKYKIYEDNGPEDYSMGTEEVVDANPLLKGLHKKLDIMSLLMEIDPDLINDTTVAEPNPRNVYSKIASRIDQSISKVMPAMQAALDLIPEGNQASRMFTSSHLELTSGSGRVYDKTYFSSDLEAMLDVDDYNTELSGKYAHVVWRNTNNTTGSARGHIVGLLNMDETVSERTPKTRKTEATVKKVGSNQRKYVIIHSNENPKDKNGKMYTIPLNDLRNVNIGNGQTNHLMFKAFNTRALESQQNVIKQHSENILKHAKKTMKLDYTKILDRKGNHIANRKIMSGNDLSAQIEFLDKKLANDPMSNFNKKLAGYSQLIPTWTYGFGGGAMMTAMGVGALMLGSPVGIYLGVSGLLNIGYRWMSLFYQGTSLSVGAHGMQNNIGEYLSYVGETKEDEIVNPYTREKSIGAGVDVISPFYEKSLREKEATMASILQDTGEITHIKPKKIFGKIASRIFNTELSFEDNRVKFKPNDRTKLKLMQETVNKWGELIESLNPKTNDELAEVVRKFEDSHLKVINADKKLDFKINTAAGKAVITLEGQTLDKMKELYTDLHTLYTSAAMGFGYIMKMEQRSTKHASAYANKMLSVYTNERKKAGMGAFKPNDLYHDVQLSLERGIMDVAIGDHRKGVNMNTFSATLQFMYHNFKKESVLSETVYRARKIRLENIFKEELGNALDKYQARTLKGKDKAFIEKLLDEDLYIGGNVFVSQAKQLLSQVGGAAATNTLFGGLSMLGTTFGLEEAFGTNLLSSRHNYKATGGLSGFKWLIPSGNFATAAIMQAMYTMLSTLIIDEDEKKTKDLTKLMKFQDETVSNLATPLGGLGTQEAVELIGSSTALLLLAEANRGDYQYQKAKEKYAIKRKERMLRTLGLTVGLNSTLVEGIKTYEKIYDKKILKK